MTQTQGKKLPVVYIVDDDEGARDSIGWMLRSRRLLSEAFSSAEAFEAVIDAHPEQSGGSTCWPNQPSCLILDLRMPGTNGLVLFDRLLARRLLERVPVIFLTGHGDVETAVTMVKRGAFQFIEKPFSAPALMQHIDAALSASDAALAQAAHERTTARLLDSLTAREREVIYYVLTGHSSPEIGNLLGMSFHTADAHRLRAYKKFGVSSVTQLSNRLRSLRVDPDELLLARETGLTHTPT